MENSFEKAIKFRRRKSQLAINSGIEIKIRIASQSNTIDTTVCALSSSVVEAKAESTFHTDLFNRWTCLFDLLKREYYCDEIWYKEDYSNKLQYFDHL